MEHKVTLKKNLTKQIIYDTIQADIQKNTYPPAKVRV